ARLRQARAPWTVLGVAVASFTLPYLAREGGSAWQSRYLYFPAAAAALVAGFVLGELPSRRLAPLLCACALIGVSTTEPGAMPARSSSGWTGAVHGLVRCTANQ